MLPNSSLDPTGFASGSTPGSLPGLMPARDVTWSRAAREGLALLVLPWKLLMRSSRAERPALLEIRTIATTSPIVFGLMFFVLTFIDLAPRGGVLGFTIATLGAGVLTVAGIGRRMRKRRLDTSGPVALAKSYRVAYFLSWGDLQLPALVGFVGVFATGRLWMFLVGVAFSLIGLVLTAPSDANIERAQQRLRDQGSALSLREALMLPSALLDQRRG